MNLRYQGEDAQDRTRSVLPGLIKGHIYDVAEILEDPGWLMVREVGEAHWPVPGSNMFQIDPFLFESAEEPIEIRSCGYTRMVYYQDHIGVFYQDSESINVMRVGRKCLLDLCSPHSGERYVDWRSRCGETINENLIEYCYSMRLEPLQEPEIQLYDDVIAPRNFFGSIGIISYSCADLVRNRVNREWAIQAIARFADALGLKRSNIDILDLEMIWRGNGAPRIINSRSEFIK